MIKYIVGGYVRDKLLGMEPKDRDWVVVGATPEQMISLGYKQVGASFPVFLHPETGEEYALARTEKKNGIGYKGFDCYFGTEVTLEEDLARRDLTINAIAWDPETNKYFDPFEGIKDLHNKVLRPTTDAFCQDPLRVFRAARFLARYPAFTSDEEDMLFRLSDRVCSEFNALSKERVWLETEKALQAASPSRYFDWMMWWNVFPEIYRLSDVEQPVKWHPEGDAYTHTMLAVDFAAQNFKDPVVTFGALMHDLGKAVAFKQQGNLYGHEQLGVPVINSFCDKWKVPNEYRTVAVRAAAYHTNIHNSFKLKALTIVDMLQRMRAMQQTEVFKQVLQVCTADANGRGMAVQEYTQAVFMLECVEAIKNTDVSDIVKKNTKSVDALKNKIRQAYGNAIKEVQAKWKS